MTKPVYELPPCLTNENGAKRKVGVEIEFGGLAGRDAAEAVADAVGGRVWQVSAHHFEIADTALGDLSVELDLRLAHPDDDSGGHEFLDAARETMGDIAQLVVPYELVVPPQPIDELAAIDDLTASLGEAGAEGTGASLVYAFGLHLNPETRSLRPDYLLSVLRAFVLLNDWLRARIRPDATRRLLAWVDPYEAGYAERILSPDYAPTITGLIEDYVHANPDRNYDLDMLPLFAAADERLVSSLIADMKSKPRPTFHFRLPDSRIDEDGWSVSSAWNLWVEVERLAGDEARIERMMAARNQLLPGRAAS